MLQVGNCYHSLDVVAVMILVKHFTASQWLSYFLLESWAKRCDDILFTQCISSPPPWREEQRNCGQKWGSCLKNQESQRMILSAKALEWGSCSTTQGNGGHGGKLPVMRSLIIFPFKSRLYFSGVARACEASQCCGWVEGVQENPVCLQLRCLIWFQPIPSTSSYQFNEFCIWVQWTLRVRVSYDTGEPLTWRW